MAAKLRLEDRMRLAVESSCGIAVEPDEVLHFSRMLLVLRSIVDLTPAGRRCDVRHVNRLAAEAILPFRK